MSAKVTAMIYEFEEGSDDPRAIEGGGGDSWVLLERRTNSLWLLKAYIRALKAHYGEEYKMRLIKAR